MKLKQDLRLRPDLLAADVPEGLELWQITQRCAALFNSDESGQTQAYLDLNLPAES